MSPKELKDLYGKLFTSLYDTTLCLPGTRKFNSPWISAFSSPIHHEIFNIVTRCDLDSDKDYSQYVNQVVDFYSENESPIRWPVGSDSLTFLEKPLVEWGFQKSAVVYKIGIEVSNLKSSFSTENSSNIQCIDVSTDDSMLEWIDIFVKSFGLSGEFAEGFTQWISIFRKTDQNKKFMHFLFLSGSRPIGTASLFFEGPAVGVYNVALLPSFRNQSLGTALVKLLQAKIFDSQATWVLGTGTADGMRVYQKWNPIFIEEMYDFDRKSSKPEPLS